MIRYNTPKLKFLCKNILMIPNTIGTFWYMFGWVVCFFTYSAVLPRYRHGKRAKRKDYLIYSSR